MLYVVLGANRRRNGGGGGHRGTVPPVKFSRGGTNSKVPPLEYAIKLHF